MLKIIKERTPETITEYIIEFIYKDDPNAGFVFPALTNGDPDFQHMQKEAILQQKVNILIQKGVLQERMVLAHMQREKMQEHQVTTLMLKEIVLKH